MKKLMRLLRVTLCAFILVGPASAFAGQNILYYLSQAGDYIGQGEEDTYTSADGTFGAFSTVPNVAMVRFATPTFSHWWNLTIDAPDTAPLVVGAYEGAQRAAFRTAGHPGLEFTGDGRGCDTLTGRFDVLEIVRDATGAITQLAVNWEQHCEGGAPALYGQIRYNSDVPVIRRARINLENPLNTRGCVEAASPQGALVSVDANDTTDATGGKSLLYSWSSTTGDTATTPVFSFNAPIATAPASPTVVTLSVTDQTNNSVSTASKPVCVSDTTGPAITINSPVPGQNVYGDTLVLDVTIKDAVDKNITQYEILVGSDYLAPISASTGHARQNVLAAPKANGSIALTITVRAVDVSGNTAQRSVTVTQFP
ncbi:MAG TPA: hypothetical protein VFK92_15370 [Burkholderiales bacterium]|nr:hypothetical protein [Burkholderiales bacterium]